MRRVVSLWFPDWSIDRRIASRRRPEAPPEPEPTRPFRPEAEPCARKADRHDDHYRHEPANPFALSKQCEMERAGAAWSRDDVGGAPPATDRGPVWRAPKHRDGPRPEWRPRSADRRTDPAAPTRPHDPAQGRLRQGWAAYQDAADHAHAEAAAADRLGGEGQGGGGAGSRAARARGLWRDDAAPKTSQSQPGGRVDAVVPKADHKHHQNAQLTERPRSPVSRTPDRPSAVTTPLRADPAGSPPIQAKAGGPVEGDPPLALALRSGSRRLVHAACPRARAAGVAAGMTLTQALLVAPGLAVEEADLPGDGAALAAMAKWASAALSPLAAPDAPDGLFLDVTGLAGLCGGEAAMLRAFERACARRGVTARAAAADTPGAAWAWARYGRGGILPPGAGRRALGTLPPAALRLPPDAVEALAGVGVDTVAEFEALPRAPAARRYGAEALRMLDRALGSAPEPIAPVAPPRVMACDLSFAEPFLSAEPLAEAARRLLDQLCAKLALGGLGARSLALRFVRVDGETQTVTAGTARPSRDAAHLARLLLPKLETIDPGFGIEAARLVAHPVEPLRSVQLGPETEAADGVADLLDRLANRPEAVRVARAVPVESDIPERSVALTAPHLPGEGAWPAFLPRPPRLIHPPQAVDAMAMLPDHPPIRFSWRGRHHRVVRADGPERLYGEWWRGPAEEGGVRDYFAVEDEAGARFWLFRDGDGEDPATGDMRWWLHGVFG